MATKKSPLGRQKDEHESKEKLVDRVLSILGTITKSDEDKDTLKARLLGGVEQEAAPPSRGRQRDQVEVRLDGEARRGSRHGGRSRQGCAVRRQARHATRRRACSTWSGPPRSAARRRPPKLRALNLQLLGHASSGPVWGAKHAAGLDGAKLLVVEDAGGARVTAIDRLGAGVGRSRAHWRTARAYAI